MAGRFVAQLLLLVATSASANERLEELVRGTDVTPALSGIQVSVMAGGEQVESIALGFAQLPASRPVELRRDHKVRVASISKLVVAVMWRIFSPCSRGHSRASWMVRRMAPLGSASIESIQSRT